jgi:anti-anti-sigma regulatory factor
MFRIKKIFENDLTYILKIEGEITEENLSVWTDEIRNLINSSNHQVILEICEVTYMSPKAVENLIEQLTDDIYLLNCPTFMKNMLHTAGYAKNVLD